MKKGVFARLLPHIIAIVIFLIVAVIFCSPALQGKVVEQHDVIQWRAMAQSLFEYKDQYGHFPLWTNSMFSGMPAFQIAMESQNFFSVGYFHYLFTLFLSKPISFFFLICISFYFLCQVFRINPWISIIGALAYGYATYNPVIVAVGHDTKMLAMAYMPAMFGALVLLFEKKYWIGGALTALISALFVGMNHLQINYYFLLSAGFMTLMYLYRWIKEKDFKHITIALSIALVAGTVGVLSNATNMFVTYDYSKATMRNGTLSLDTTQNAKEKKAGLPIDYAFYWGSVGKAETFTFLFPGIYGGSSSGELSAGSNIAEKLSAMGVGEEQAEQFAASAPTYWGPQPSTSGPVYLGAIICFLFIFGMVYLKTWHKWWILAACILAVLMSWGKNFEGFNTFMFNYLPFYNKFRAPSIFLVIPQFGFALVAVMALQRLFFGEDSKEEKWRKFKLSCYITGGVLLVGVLMYFSFDYRSENDESIKQYFLQVSGNQQDFANEMYNALREDRQSLFGGDLLRSIILILLSAGLIGLYIHRKLSFAVAVGGLLILNLYDLFGVGKRYLSSENFIYEDEYNAAYTPSPADMQIKTDTGYYRVLNLTKDVFNDAITSYHHNSVGGYHPAKLSITEDLLSYQLRKQPMNINVLNMLNTKYVITQDPQGGQPMVQQNPQALGAAWFVDGVEFKKGWLNVMNGLNNFNPSDVAIVEEGDRNLVALPTQQDSAANIQLVRNINDEIIYRSNSSTGGFGVFSEIFYDRGWKAYIDGKETPIIRTNYALRGLSIPAGIHEVKFEFKPQAYYTGETIALIANLLILVFLIVAAFKYYRQNRIAKTNG